MTTTLLAVAMLAAGPHARPAATPTPPSRPTGSQPSVGKEVRTIPLDNRAASHVHPVHTAPSYPCTIEFPEAFTGPPACGDCGEKGLFRLDVFNEGRYLTIKPRTFAGSQSDGTTIAVQDFRTLLTVRLQTYTLTIDVSYTEDPSQADPRVVFTIPQRASESAYVQAELAKGRRALEEEMAAKIQSGIRSGFLRALVDPHWCNRLNNRTRNDFLVMEAQEACHFGDTYYIRFTIENRGRVPADISELSLKYGSGSALTEAHDVEQYLSSDHIEFQATATAVIGFRLESGQPAPRRYELTAREQGGPARVVTLAGIEP
jgi:hypothetical protein